MPHRCHQSLHDRSRSRDEIAPRGGPGVPGGCRVRIRDMLQPEIYRRIRRSFFRVHYQYIFGNTKPYWYDFFQICCAPTPLLARAEQVSPAPFRSRTSAKHDFDCRRHCLGCGPRCLGGIRAPHQRRARKIKSGTQTRALPAIGWALGAATLGLSAVPAHLCRHRLSGLCRLCVPPVDGLGHCLSNWRSWRCFSPVTGNTAGTGRFRWRSALIMSW